MARQLVIGSRGSQLALAQSHMVRDLLQARHAQLEVEIEIIRTRGDATSGSLRSFGGQGVFTRQIEEALLAGQIDLAVHSLKDLPTRFHGDLVLVATPRREDVRDVLVGPEGARLDELPAGARIGTGSLRRRAQLLALRPDLEFVDIRGNIDTRIARVAPGDCTAVVLAAAAFHRLGWRHRISAYLETDQVLPAPGQAALGLQMRLGDELVPYVDALNHAPTFAAVGAERSLLRRLGTGCHAPVGAWGRLEGGQLHLDGRVGSPDGRCLLHGRISGSLEAARDLGAELAERLNGRGAAAILDALDPS